MKPHRHFLSAVSAVLALGFIIFGTLYAQSNLISSQQPSATQTIIIKASQYTEFLSAVAKTDPHNLYESAMETDPSMATIVRFGKPGHYCYSVLAGKEDSAMTYVDQASAMHFYNWMENGQPIDDQGSETTDEGLYSLDSSIVINDQLLNAFISSEEDAVTSLKSNKVELTLTLQSDISLLGMQVSSPITPSINHGELKDIAGFLVLAGGVAFMLRGSNNTRADRAQDAVDSSNMSAITSIIETEKKPLITTDDMSSIIHGRGLPINDVFEKSSTSEVASKTGDFFGSSMSPLQESPSLKSESVISSDLIDNKQLNELNDHKIVQAERSGGSTTPEQRSSDEKKESDGINSKDSTPEKSEGADSLEQSTGIVNVHRSIKSIATSREERIHQLEQAVQHSKAVVQYAEESSKATFSVYDVLYSVINGRRDDKRTEPLTENCYSVRIASDAVNNALKNLTQRLVCLQNSSELDIDFSQDTRELIRLNLAITALREATQQTTIVTEAAMDHERYRGEIANNALTAIRELSPSHDALFNQADTSTRYSCSSIKPTFLTLTAKQEILRQLLRRAEIESKYATDLLDGPASRFSKILATTYHDNDVADDCFDQIGEASNNASVALATTTIAIRNATHQLEQPAENMPASDDENFFVALEITTDELKATTEKLVAAIGVESPYLQPPKEISESLTSVRAAYEASVESIK